MFINKIKTVWRDITGHRTQFTIQERIFHSASAFAIFALFYYVPFNWFVGLHTTALLSLVALIVVIIAYRLSRYKDNANAAMLIIAVTGYVFYSFNYFFNSGINGPNDLSFILCFFLITCCVPRWQMKYWLIVTLLVMIILHYVEYRYPQAVPNSYKTEFERILDVNSAYAVAAILIYVAMMTLRETYDDDRILAMNRNNIITSRHESVVVHNNALEKLNADNNKLLAILAHDLRSPLATIQNYLEFLNAGILDPEEKLMIEGRLLTVTKETTTMLSDLLLWSKSQLSGTTLNIKCLNLSDFLERFLTLEIELSVIKNISIEIDVSKEIHLNADFDMLKIVVRNLVGNAIKFLPPGGIIHISTSVETNYCKLMIADNGKGVAPEKQSMLFSPGTSSILGTANEIGSGLGLTLCRNLMEVQGGKIGYENSKENGSCFYLLLPACLQSDNSL